VSGRSVPAAGKHLLLLNATYRDKITILAAAKRLRLVVSMIGPRLEPWAAPFIDSFIPADPDDTAATVSAACDLQRRMRIDGVFSLWDRDVPLCARVAEALGLPGCPVEAADRVRNKYLSRMAFDRCGVPQPRYARVTDWQGLRVAARRIGYPLIYKPVGASASRAILRVNSDLELRRAHSVMERYARPALDPMFRFNAGVRLVEEFMEGPEFSVEGLVVDGGIQTVVVTDKWTTDDYFLEWQHALPSRLPSPARREVLACARAAVAALGLDNTAFHVEVKLTSEGCKVVEVNGRLAGDFLATHLVPLALGYDIVQQALLLALGEPVRVRVRRRGGACVRFLFSRREGRVSGWRGAEKAGRLPGVVEITLEKSVGDRVRLPPKRFTQSRLARVIARGITTDRAIAAAERAASELRCIIEPCAGPVREAARS
jgi:biotin carboxylase